MSLLQHSRLKIFTAILMVVAVFCSAIFAFDNHADTQSYSNVEFVQSVQSADDLSQTKSSGLVGSGATHSCCLHFTGSSNQYLQIASPITYAIEILKPTQNPILKYDLSNKMKRPPRF